jgi:hypothetical protein
VQHWEDSNGLETKLYALRIRRWLHNLNSRPDDLAQINISAPKVQLSGHHPRDIEWIVDKLRLPFAFA